VKREESDGSEEGRVKGGARVSATTELSQTRPAGHGSLFPLPLNSSFFTLRSSLFTKKAPSYPRGWSWRLNNNLYKNIFVEILVYYFT